MATGRFCTSVKALNSGRDELILEEHCIKALQAFLARDIRELRNVIERAVLLSDQRSISIKDLHFRRARKCLLMPPWIHAFTLLELEKRHIERVHKRKTERW